MLRTIAARTCAELREVTRKCVLAVVNVFIFELFSKMPLRRGGLGRRLGRKEESLSCVALLSREGRVFFLYLSKTLPSTLLVNGNTKQALLLLVFDG